MGELKLSVVELIQMFVSSNRRGLFYRSNQRQRSVGGCSALISEAVMHASTRWFACREDKLVINPHEICRGR